MKPLARVILSAGLLGVTGCQLTPEQRDAWHRAAGALGEMGAGAGQGMQDAARDYQRQNQQNQPRTYSVFDSTTGTWRTVTVYPQ
jgi:hypothetical protein